MFTATSEFCYQSSMLCCQYSRYLRLYLKNDENSDDIQKCIEYGLNAAGFMAQYNKLTNMKGKVNHRSDSSHEYHHLSSPSVPYTDFLLGHDVPSSV